MAFPFAVLGWAANYVSIVYFDPDHGLYLHDLCLVSMIYSIARDGLYRGLSRNLIASRVLKMLLS